MQINFESCLQNLANFRDPGDKTRANIAIKYMQNEPFFIVTEAKPGFWKRFIYFFYKPKHLRLNHIVEKTISFLEKYESLCKTWENFEKLQQFRSKLLAIRSFNAKVDVKVRNRFKQFVDTVEKDLVKQSEESLAKAKQIHAANSNVRAQKLESSIHKISELENDLNKQKKTLENLREERREKLYTSLSAKKIQLTFFGNNKGPSLEMLTKIAKPDLVLECIFGQKVHTFSELFMEFMEKKVNVVGKNTPIQINEQSEDVEKFINYYYKDVKTAEMTFEEYISISHIAQTLQVPFHSSLDLGVLDTSLCVYALEIIQRKPFKRDEEAEKNSNSLENVLLHLIDHRPTSNNVPRRVFKLLVPFLSQFKSVHSEKVLEKWKNEGVV